MINDETYSMLREMHLGFMAKEYMRQENLCLEMDSVPFQTRIQMLAAEYNGRHDSRLQRLLKNSGLPQKDANPHALYIGNWNTWLACCIGVSACMQDKSVSYATIEDLCIDIQAASSDLKLSDDVFKKYAKCRLLIAPSKSIFIVLKLWKEFL